MAHPFPQYTDYDALGLADLIRRGHVSAEEVIESAILRIEELNPRLNAVVTPLYDAARRELAEMSASAPLYGVPFLIKDLILTYQGVPTTASSRFYTDVVPAEDSFLMKRFRKAGLVTLGKTNTPELGILAITESELRGACRNPWNTDYTPGGSSGGSAAAVSSRMVPVAHGNDGGGSIRIPASCCGLVGFKPSRGRNPLGPIFLQGAFGLIEEHVLSRTVRDSAFLLDLTRGPEFDTSYVLEKGSSSYLAATRTPRQGLRIAYSDEPLLGSETDEECRKALAETVALCRKLGHTVTEAAPEVNAQRMVDVYFTLTTAALSLEIVKTARVMHRRISRKDFELITYFLHVLGLSVKSVELSDALHEAQMASLAVAHFFTDYDVLLTPTLAYPPVRIGSMDLTLPERLALEVLSRLPVRPLMKTARRVMGDDAVNRTPNTQLFNITGNPSVSLPIGWSTGGLPIGIQCSAGYRKDALLFSLAGELERERQWASYRPPL